MKSNGGVLSADEVVHQPITTVLSGPAAGALGAALIAQKAGFDKVLTCDGGGTSTDVSVVLDGEPTLTTEGTVGAYPSKIPMIDVVTVGAGGGSIAWVSPEGALKVGPHSAGADPGPLCYGKGGTEPDDHRRPRHPRPHPPAPARRRDPARRRRGPRRHRGARRPARPRLRALRHRHPRDLGVEPGQRPAPGLGQARPRRARLHAHDLRRLRLAARLPPRRHPRPRRRRRPAEPRQRQRLRPAHRRRQERLRPDAGGQADRARPRGDREDVQPSSPRGRPRRSTRRASPPRSTSSPAPSTCATSARPTRCGSPRPPTCPSTPPTPRRSPTAFHDEHRQLYGYDFRDDPRQQVEWVNLRVTGVGPITRPELRELAPPPQTPARSRTAPVARPARSASTPRTATSTPASGGGPTSRAGDTIDGPAIIEEFGSTVPVHPGFTVRGRRLRQPRHHQGGK